MVLDRSLAFAAPFCILEARFSKGPGVGASWPPRGWSFSPLTNPKPSSIRRASHRSRPQSRAARTWRRIRDERWPHCEWVFYRYGEKVKSFRTAWDEACRRADLCDKERNRPTRIFHDLRRTGARNLVRAGERERVVMAIGGWKTRSVFDRYNIVSEKDLHEAAGRLECHLAEKRQPRTKQGQKVLSKSSSLVTH